MAEFLERIYIADPRQRPDCNRIRDLFRQILMTENPQQVAVVPSGTGLAMGNLRIEEEKKEIKKTTIREKNEKQRKQIKIKG